MPTLIDSRQSRNRSALSNIGSSADATLDTILGLIDSNVGSSGTSSNQDRSVKLISGGTWRWDLTSTTLSLSSDAYVQIPGLENQRNTISAGDITLTADGQVAYVQLTRSGTGANILSVSTGLISSLTLTDNIFIIARRIGNDVNVSNAFTLKDGELLELDGALAEINRYFSQLRLKEHPSNKKRIIVTGSDTSQLDGTLLGQTLNNLVLKFDGAEIDFSTGSIYENDGSTPLGINFTIHDFTGNADHYYYYSVSLLASDINADNTINAQVFVLGATTSNAVLLNAPKSVYGSGLPLGHILVQNDSVTSVTAIEDINQSNIIRLGIGSGSGGGGGSANDMLTDYKIALSQSIYELLSYVIFDLDTNEKTDGASTATLSYASSPVTYKFATGETYITTDLLDASFTEDLLQVDVQVNWDLDYLDDNAIYEISRDGGTTWETLTLERASSSNTYYGKHIFTEDISTAQNLVVKITASQDDVELQGIGVYYDAQPSSSGTEALNYEKFVISSATNVTEFTLSDFIPVEELVECHVLETGQVFKADNNNSEVMSVEGLKVIFPDNHFYDLPARTLTLIFCQNKGQTIDFNEINGALLSENHLGSEDASLDKSVNGRGIKLRRPDGVIREITIDNSDNIVINSLP